MEKRSLYDMGIKRKGKKLSKWSKAKAMASYKRTVRIRKQIKENCLD